MANKTCKLYIRSKVGYAPSMGAQPLRDQFARILYGALDGKVVDGPGRARWTRSYGQAVTAAEAPLAAQVHFRGK
jgi:hypothetical protein